MSRYSETLYDSYGQEFEVGEIYFENKTEHQHLIIFHNALFGRVMALDGVIQTTEADEFIYHEMMTHVPMFAHGNAQRVLIVGGGDGGILREVLRHPSVEKVVQVEIDQQVIEVCKEFLPKHSQGAFDDLRVELVIDDGLNYVQRCQDKFDVILSDSTDPIGPGETLFGENFYAACKRCMNFGAVMTMQNGVVFMQRDEVTTTAQRLKNLYQDTTFYTGAVPTYIGGMMTFAWASNDSSLRRVDAQTLEQRFVAANIDTKYYTPEIHQACFALPRYVQQALNKAIA